MGRSDGLTVGGLLPLLWETLQRLGYTEPPMYYCREYDEEGVLKCEVCLHIPKHPSCPTFQPKYITVYGREYYDTVQKAARQALAEFCQIFEEDIEHPSARFFSVPNQTTPTWHEKVWDLGKISPQAPEYTEVFNVRYMHALDAIFED